MLQQKIIKKIDFDQTMEFKKLGKNIHPEEKIEDTKEKEKLNKIKSILKI